MLRFTTPRRPTFAALTSIPGVAFAAVLTVGGVVAWRDPLMRPPRLPNRRPPAWGLPVAGVVYGVGVVGAARVVARGGRFFPAAIAAAGLSAAAVPGAMAPLFELARRTVARRGTGPAGTVVVLGCALREGRPSSLLRHRLELAEAVARRGAPPRIGSGAVGESAVGLSAATDATVICCGGIGDGDEVSEAEVMADWLRERGIADVRLEAESTSTFENLAHAAPMVEKAPVTIVTSDFHVFRAKSLARRGGLVAWRVEGAPTPARYWATSMLREFLALGAWWPAPGAAAGISLFGWWLIRSGDRRRGRGVGVVKRNPPRG